MSADDIVQSAFQYILEHYDDKKYWKLRNLERYLMAIVRNNARSTVREEKENRSWAESQACSADLTEDPVFLSVERQYDLTNLKKAFALLHPKSAEHLKLHYWKRCTDREIAVQMCVSDKSVPVLRHRAKKELSGIMMKLDDNLRDI